MTTITLNLPPGVDLVDLQSVLVTARTAHDRAGAEIRAWAALDPEGWPRAGITRESAERLACEQDAKADIARALEDQVVRAIATEQL